MPEFKETSRYDFAEEDNPTLWRDLTDNTEFRVDGAREGVKLFRVHIPRGAHAHGSEFPMFAVAREDSAMDSSFSPNGELAAREVGIVHRVGVAIAPFVCDQPTNNTDIAKVISNAYLAVQVNGSPLIEGSFETLPIGFGAWGHGVSNGLPAADSVPVRTPLLFTNPAMRFTGTLSFPHRRWLCEAMGEQASEPDPESNCPPPAVESVLTLDSHLLVTFYMLGVFGRVREETLE